MGVESVTSGYSDGRVAARRRDDHESPRALPLLHERQRAEGFEGDRRDEPLERTEQDPLVDDLPNARPGEPKTGQRAGKPNWSAVEERQGLPSAGAASAGRCPPPPQLPWPAQTSAFGGGLIQDSFFVASGDWPVGVSAAPSPARRRCVLLVKTLG